jgi:hypothetical protein
MDGWKSGLLKLGQRRAILETSVGYSSTGEYTYVFVEISMPFYPNGRCEGKEKHGNSERLQLVWCGGLMATLVARVLDGQMRMGIG